MRPDSSGLATSTCIYVQIKQLKKWTSKASFYSLEQLESESLAEVQFVIDSCRLVSQPNYSNVIGLSFSVLYQRLVHGWRHFYSFGKLRLV